MSFERFIQFLRRNDMEEIDKIIFMAYMNKDDERFKTLFCSYPGFEDVSYWFYGMIDNLNFEGKFFDIDLAKFFADFFWNSFNPPQVKRTIFDKEQNKYVDILSHTPPNIMMYESNEDRFGGSEYVVACWTGITTLRRENFSNELVSKVRRLNLRGQIIWCIRERKSELHVCGVVHSMEWLYERKREFKEEGLI